VRASHWCATFVAGTAFAFSSALVQGQNPPNRPLGAPTAPAAPAAQAPPSGTSVVVIDVKFIFDNYTSFKTTMDSIKKEYDAFEAGVRETEASLRKQIEQLKAMQPGSPEFKQLEEQIAQTRTQVQLDINRKQKERVDEEAKVYHRAYQAVEAEIAKFAARYGIDLVLQFSTSEIDPAKPDTVIRGLNRLVVYQNQLNITSNILQELNRTPAPTPRPAPTPIGGLNSNRNNGPVGPKTR
jgi:Skp family chaperone for outer membrane proteins